jgi:hypothetical protein
MHKSSFLHLASCLLHLASCLLHPASCILRLASCLLHLASCLLHLAPCILLPASCFLLSGCIAAPPEPTAEPTQPAVSSPLTGAFPGADAVAGWTPDGEIETYDGETIFDLVDGQADFFFVYGFERVAVQRYRNTEEVVLDVQIWQMIDDEGAYGLFSAGVAGEPVDVGNEGDVDPGRRLVFWQDRYVAQLFARKEIPDADLRAFAGAVSAALPAGGERPALVDRLPASGMFPRSTVFFHEELSIQNEVWLGGENILGLNPDTDGILARYEIDGATVRLLLVAYPDVEAASAAVEALERGGIERLVTAGTRDHLLGAVFGEVDEAAARALLEKALK